MSASSPRLVALERLAANIELEIRAERRALRSVPSRGPGRPPLRRPDDHGTERDYQAERYARRKGGAPPCETCKAAHALYNRRKARERRKRGMAVEHRPDPMQLTVYDALREA